MDITSYLLGKQAGGGSTPTGTIDITENGTYNVSSYASADVDVQPDLEEKSITISTNTTTTIRPTEGKDGLSSVEITTNVPQPSGKIEITQNGTDIDVSSYATADVSVGGNKFELDGGITFAYDTRSNLQPVIDNIIANVDMNSINNLHRMFYYCQNITTLDLSNFIIVNPINCVQSFAGDSLLTSLNLSGLTLTDNINCQAMFYDCRQLMFLDIRNMELNKITTAFYYNNMLGVPNNCLIIVKDAPQKQWINTNFPSMTNVKTVAEYEGS